MTNWRAFGALSLLLAVVGCGNTENDGVISQIWHRLTASQEPTGPAPDISVLRAALTPDVLAQFNGPVLIAQVPSMRSSGVLTPAGGNPRIETFVSGDGVSISLRKGMIVGTRGFGFDRMDSATCWNVLTFTPG